MRNATSLIATAGSAIIFSAGTALAGPISTSLDVPTLRTPLINQGYLNFVRGGEERTGRTDARNPAYYTGTDGLSTTITNTRDNRGIGYDRSDFRIEVRNVITTDRNGVTAAPSIERDYNYANQIYGQLGISGLSRGNVDAAYGNVANPLSGAAANLVLDANRVASPTINNYYVQRLEVPAGSFPAGLARSPEERANHGTLIANAPNVMSFAHELGHFVLDSNGYFVPGAGGFHTPTTSELMSPGDVRREGDGSVKRAAGPHQNTAPSQSGQLVGPIGGLGQFEALAGPVGGPFTTPQIDVLFGNASDGVAYVQRTDNDLRYGDRADFKWVEDNIPLELAASRTGSNGRMDNHRGTDFMVWEINPGAVNPPIIESLAVHDKNDWGELALPAFNRPVFRVVDVVSQIARYADMDVEGGGWSPRESALDYQLQFSEDLGSWFDGAVVRVFRDGWTRLSEADDWIARWVSPINARYVRISPTTASGLDDRNVQIDAIIAGAAIPAPAAITLFAAGLALLAAASRRRRLTAQRPCCAKKRSISRDASGPRGSV